MSHNVSAGPVMYSMWWQRIWLLGRPLLLHYLQYTKSSMYTALLYIT